ncbi:DUF5937 family protein [Streptomyces sp. enrichment culture]|uniref:ArsR/SmtB family transcription factor n=1 Tax=Streptomyces sp. enrichment culture TaxID=1795815 RepID=UPI003F54E467
MPTHLHFEEGDYLNCRFAHSPLWETQAAAHMLKRPDRQAYQRPWLRRTRRRTADLDLTPLWLLMPQRGLTPGWLCPPQTTPAAGFEEELAHVRAADPDAARADAVRSLRATPGALGLARDRGWLRHPSRMIREVSDTLEQMWTRLVEPDWPRMRTLLEADIAFRTRQLAEHGLGELLPGISALCSWRPGTLTVQGRADLERRLDGQGLVLMPSVFVWPHVIGSFEPPLQPVLAYPARGIVELWAEPAPHDRDTLPRLLGRGRAAILCSLDAPASTTGLAERLNLAPSSVSSHLTVLREAGLLTARRHGRQVLYERTGLGDALTTGS